MNISIDLQPKRGLFNSRTTCIVCMLKCFPCYLPIIRVREECSIVGYYARVRVIQLLYSGLQLIRLSTARLCRCETTSLYRQHAIQNSKHYRCLCLFLDVIDVLPPPYFPRHHSDNACFTRLAPHFSCF